MPFSEDDFDEERGILKINCLGFLYGASLEDYEEVMERVINKILEVKNVNSIVLLKEREYDYGPEQTRLLTEFAGAIEEIIRERIILNLVDVKCKRFFGEWGNKLKYIVFDLIRKDPVGAYVELIREIRRANIGLKKVPKVYKGCYNHYIENILEVLKEKLEKTELIQRASSFSQLAGYHIGDRSVYRQIFSPSVRPNFMLTRYMMAPPEGGKRIEKYTIGENNDTEVSIFKLPGEAQYMYHVIPPEFRLSESHYTILDEALRYMASRGSTATEFVKSEERKYIQNIGEGLVKQMADRRKVTLSTKDLETLTTILTRYTAGLGVLEILLTDSRIEDIYANSPVERLPLLIKHANHEECKTNLIPTQEDAMGWATRLRSYSGRPLDEANPVLDTELSVPGGRARFAVITKTLSPEGLGFAVRRHRDSAWTLPLYMQPKIKMMDPLAAGLISFLADNSASILVAGGRGSGKTSLLGAMMLELLPRIRMIVIEDTLELPVRQLRGLGYNIEGLKSRSVITQIETEISADAALRTALRLGESSLIVGEIRSLEAKVLWEAMRIGALSNVVAGTIHGESAYGVYDRVVNDLEVKPTSFKATDIVVICRKLRSPDGLHSYRRVVNITEVRKHWNEDPVREGGFVDLMTYSGKEDQLKPTDTLINGESEVLNRISSFVKEWAGSWENVWENIQLRAKVKETMVKYAQKTSPRILEADWNVKSNNMFHSILDDVKSEVGGIDTKRVYEEWTKWFKNEVKDIK